MKRLIATLTLLPGLALAHGMHAPVPEEAHGMAHAAPYLAIPLIALVAVIWYRGRSS